MAISRRHRRPSVLGIALHATLATLALALLVSPAAARKPRKIEIGVGAAGFMNGTFMSDLPDNKKIVQVNGQDVLVPYPGFWGLGGGGGVQLNAMYRGFIGMQLDLLFSQDNGQGEITINDGTPAATEIKLEMSQGAFHIPLMVKAAIPLKSVRPFLLLGPEFVIPGDPEMTTDPSLAQALKAEADPYINLTTGFGFEFLVPAEGVDLRIPLSIRGSFNFGTADDVKGRMSITDQGQIAGINSEWEYQAFIMLGLTWYQYVD
jgi:hypothetical protein